MRKTRLSLALAALLIPGRGFALSLGEIEVSSPLNQPLEAKILLRAVEQGDLESMEISLGSREQFERAGLDRPFVLSQVQFVIVPGGSGQAHIKVFSDEPIAEPFLNFLVEVNWPRGHVLREYTVLLDPPLYGSEFSRQSNPIPGASLGAGPVAFSGDEYRVQAGDTLWAIAQQVRPDPRISAPRMMLALLQANPQAFNNGNINDLRAGAVLRVPTLDDDFFNDANSVAAEVNRQYALWQEYRQGGIADVPIAPSGGLIPNADQVSTAAPPEALEPPAPQEPAPTASLEAPLAVDGRLRLVAAGSATEGTGAGSAAEDDRVDVLALRDELSLALEEADSRRREGEELTERLSEAEEIIGDLQRLVSLKEDEIAALQRKLVEDAQTEAAATQAIDAPDANAAEQALTGETGDAPSAPVGVPGTPDAPLAETPQTDGQSTEPAADSEVVAQSDPASETAAESDPASGTVAESDPASETVAESDPAGEIAAGGAGAAEAIQEVQQEPTPASTPTPAEQPNFKEKFESLMPFSLATMGGGLLGIIALLGGILFWRKKRAGSTVTEDGEVALLDDEAAFVSDTPAGETTVVDGDGIKTVDADELEVQEMADDDPLAEVNVYLAYERFDEAENVVRNAVAQYPQRHDYKLKLLETFHAAKNVSAFRETAQLHAEELSADSALSGPAEKWWAELSPGAGALFADPEAATGPSAGDSVFRASEGEAVFGGRESDTIDVAKEGDDSSASGAGVDFDLSFEGETGASSQSHGVDFDLGISTEDSFDPSEGDDPADAIDFDLGEIDGDTVAKTDDDDTATPGSSAGIAAAAAAAAAGGLAAVGLTGDGANAKTNNDGDDAQSEQESGLDFDLGSFGQDEPAVSTDPRPLPERIAGEGSDGAFDLDLDLDLGDPATTAGTAESSGGLDLDLGSFDSDSDSDAGANDAAAEGSPTDAAAMPTSPDSTLTMTPSEASLDSPLDVSLETTGEAVPGASSSEVDLDIDFGGLEAPDLQSAGLELEANDETPSAGAANVEDLGLSGLQDPMLEMSTVQLSDHKGDAGDDDALADFDFGDAASDPEKASAEDPAASVATTDGAHGEDYEDTQFELRDVGEGTGLGSLSGTGTTTGDGALVFDRSSASTVDEIQTKIDLAEAYIDMGDTDGAKSILDEVVDQGSEEQKSHAQGLLEKLV